MTSRLKKNITKKAYSIGATEEDILEAFPNAKKVNENQYIAKKDGMNIYIGWDSIFSNWKVFGRTTAEPNVFQKLMNFLINK